VLDLDGDGNADGRDTTRVSLRGDWRRNWVTTPGIIATIAAEGTADFYDISQDAVYSGNETRLHGALSTELRWPLIKAGANGVSHIIEPVAQLVWAPGGADHIPNEDSTMIEFDETNLFAVNRYSGTDEVERGTWLSLGTTYTRYDPSGWSMSLAGGRVMRYRDLDQFSTASGLDGKNSDWLVAWQLTMSQGISLTSRILFNDHFETTKSEIAVGVARPGYSFSVGYVSLPADTMENRTDDLSEMHLDARYEITPNWTGTAMTRYDFDDARATRAGVGFEWRNECIAVDLSLSRRFTSSTNVRADTNFSLSVQLVGFGGGAKRGPARSCTG
jgi:LPS-assembly protein